MKWSLIKTVLAAFLVVITFAFVNIEDSKTDTSFEWQTQESGTKASLRGVSAVSEKIAWASGSSATVLRTLDGGKTWETIKTTGDSSLDYRDVQGFDADTAIIMSAGRPAKIYKTTDAGKSWQECYSNNSEGVFLNSIAFWDWKNGIAVGDPLDGYFIVLITQDGGESWKRIPAENIPAPHGNEAQFAASGTCVKVLGNGKAWFATGGSTARVFRSSDYGRTWSVADTRMLSGVSSQGIFSVDFYDEMTGAIVGGDYQAPERKIANSAITRDGGITWQLIKENGPQGFRSCVAYLPGSDGRVMINVGVSGSDCSRSGGESWNLFSNTGFHAFSFSPDGTGWAVGSEGRIAQLVHGSSDKN